MARRCSAPVGRALGSRLATTPARLGPQGPLGAPRRATAGAADQLPAPLPARPLSARTRSAAGDPRGELQPPAARAGVAPGLPLARSFAATPARLAGAAHAATALGGAAAKGAAVGTAPPSAACTSAPAAAGAATSRTAIARTAPTGNTGRPRPDPRSRSKLQAKAGLSGVTQGPPRRPHESRPQR
jgi:hypothetical protein